MNHYKAILTELKKEKMCLSNLPQGTCIKCFRGVLDLAIAESMHILKFNPEKSADDDQKDIQLLYSIKASTTKYQTFRYLESYTLTK